MTTNPLAEDVMTAAVCLPLLALLGLSGPAAGAAAVALVGSTVYDGTGRPPLSDATVLVREGRIAEVGPRAIVRVPPGTERVDVAGRWIIPGLIDAHVHFFQSSGLYARPDVIDLRAARPYVVELRRVWQCIPSTLARYLSCGITGVLDTGGPWANFSVRARAAATAASPRVAVAGPLLSPYVPPELSSEDPAIVRIRTPEEARAEVRRQLREGPDLIKLWLVRWSEGEEAWVRAAVEEARAAGVRVAAHATELEVARRAVQAGCEVLAHGVRDRVVDARFLELLRERGAVYIPTLTVNENYRKVLTGTRRPTAFERAAGDPEAIASWADVARFAPQARAAAAGWRDSFALEAENLRRVSAAGIAIAAGSDAGNIGTLHGPGLHLELERLVDAGLSPAQALSAACRGGALALGRAGEVGTLEPGKEADLVVLDGDPLADIGNTRRVRRVMKGGRLFDPPALRRACP